MKKITNLTIMMLLLIFGGNIVSAQTARVQVIHNCADAAAALVDVYANDVLLLNDFAFRTATPFVDVPAGVPISIDVAPSSSSSSADGIYNLTTTLTNGETYILVANGIVSPTGYSPAQPFQLSVFAQGRETASSATNTDILINHGSTDAPTVDVVETSVPAGVIVNNITYPSFTADYLELGTANYTINVTDATGAVTVASYSAPLAALNLQGQALTVVASGFLDPSQNSNGPAFGLYVALASGGNLIALPQSNARIQVIHNCADAAAALVDVYVNDVLLLDNFAFRNATPFVDIPAGVPVSIDVAPSNSTSSADGIYNLTTTLTNGETYIAVANGIVSPTGYTPAQPFQLSVFAQGRETASSGTNTDVLVNHGSTDAPTVDVVETSVPAGTIIDNISYPSFSSGYLELPTANYTLNVTDATGAVTVASYSAPLATLNLQGQALTVLASGFLDPSQNSNGPAFGLYVALASGGELIALPKSSAFIQVIHNCADAAAALVDVYIDDVLILSDFAFRTATPFVDLPAGVPVSIDVAPGNSNSSADSIFNLTTTLTNGETYIVVANGIVSPTGYSPAQPFQLSVFAQGRQAASSPTNTDVLVNHGSTDAPTVDVVETSVPAGTIVNNISYPSFSSNYLELPTTDYTLNVTDATGAVTVASYSAPLATLNLQGQALTVLASGFLDPTQNSNGPGFGLWAALASGGSLIPLPTLPLSTEDFESRGITAFPIPATSTLNLSIPFSFEVGAGKIIDLSGREIIAFNTIGEPINVAGITKGIYFMTLEIDNKTYSKKIAIGE